MQVSDLLAVTGHTNIRAPFRNAAGESDRTAPRLATTALLKKRPRECGWFTKQRSHSMWRQGR